MEEGGGGGIYGANSAVLNILSLGQKVLRTKEGHQQVRRTKQEEPGLVLQRCPKVVIRGADQKLRPMSRARQPMGSRGGERRMLPRSSAKKRGS